MRPSPRPYQPPETTAHGPPSETEQPLSHFRPVSLQRRERRHESAFGDGERGCSDARALNSTEREDPIHQQDRGPFDV